ncbi:LON peptidase substrate-binding domain-containing protein [Croceicoccus gelatinilyticus]|uniref:LON peptidase substrate-binding domain-containing protein n=1 Tax=Croceicoccus gelatinilyticus TaxID=2835536 RepID=UPI001BD01645|nr:LON peptidase substrate-binding domain-containing protein [Croceicoccus gelatinilyticus]MBS7670869.1 LON peptidase substrate-binding domain-containing protein [Croceicoccus gelatinilyticus]
MGSGTETSRISIFPLSGALLFPGLQLPLHIFEPRYRALVTDSLARDRMIGMIQPVRPAEGSPLFEIGCLGRIDDVEALEDGRFNIVLDGLARFRTVRELDVTTPFRQIDAELLEENEDAVLLPIERASLEQESRRFADRQGYSVDWEQVSRLDDMALVNGISQVAPFDPASKQALLEASDLNERCELLVQLMQFYGCHDDDESGTLQ